MDNGTRDVTSGTRYLSLKAARAIDCNGCGDCCDSRRTDGFWTWAALPADGYRDINGGDPLIIPLERVDGGWRDRVPVPEDDLEFSPTRFRCAAFVPREDGTASCRNHDSRRPTACEQFPVWGPDVERDLMERGEAVLQTGSLPRCAWFGVVVVKDDDPRRSDREDDRSR
jgi:Fe-S-cluster containining protein